MAWCATTHGAERAQKPSRRAILAVYPAHAPMSRAPSHRCTLSNRSAVLEHLLSFARRFAALVLALVTFALASHPAWALEAASVPLDGKTLDLTPAVQVSTQPTDRIQVSTAPGADGIVRRIEVRAHNSGSSSRWAVFALANTGDEQIDRLLVAPHFRLSGSGLFWPDLGASRMANHHAEPGLRARPAGKPGCRRLPHHPRSRRGRHLRRGTEHGGTAAALSLGRRPLQGRGQQLHVLSRHRAGHLRPARAVPHHRVRHQGHGDVPGDGGARLVGAHLPLRRFRILEPRHRYFARRRPDLARRRGGVPRRIAADLLVHLPQPQPLARALQPRHHRLADRPRGASRRRHHRSVGCGGHRALLHRPHRPPRLRRHRLAGDALLRPRDHADPDVDPASGLDIRRVADRHRLPRQRHGPASALRRAGADRAADRLHGHAACLRRRRRDPRPPRRFRAQGAGADRRRRHRLGLGRAARPHLHRTGGRGNAGPAARHARGPGARLARDPAPERPRPLQDDARFGRRTPPRAHRAGFPPARRGRALSLVPPSRPPGARLRRRSHPLRRHTARRDRRAHRGRAAAPRRRARQPDRPPQPRTVPRPAGRGDHARQRREQRAGPPCSPSTSTASSR